MFALSFILQAVNPCSTSHNGWSLISSSELFSLSCLGSTSLVFIIFTSKFPNILMSNVEYSFFFSFRLGVAGDWIPAALGLRQGTPWRVLVAARADIYTQTMTHNHSVSHSLTRDTLKLTIDLYSLLYTYTSKSCSNPTKNLFNSPLNLSEHEQYSGGVLSNPLLQC